MKRYKHLANTNVFYFSREENHSEESILYSFSTLCSFVNKLLLKSLKSIKSNLASYHQHLILNRKQSTVFSWWVLKLRTKKAEQRRQEEQEQLSVGSDVTTVI